MSTLPAPAPVEVTVEGPATSFKNQIHIGRHLITADEPVADGGGGEGPNPYELLISALGACTSMTVSLYARRKQWPLESVRVHLRHSKINASDCAECRTKEGWVDRIERTIELVGPLTDEQRTRLIDIANKCPVHRTLSSEINIQTRLAASAAAAVI